ncbi:MAG: YCF48-related protein [Xanthomonadales bacterium]|nr:YCF48-related protein [Xanthomonadales bacterium]
MRRNYLILMFLCAALVVSVVIYANGATDLDVDYAEHLPLATESMVLDMTRAGDTVVAVGERGHVLLKHDGGQWTQAEVVPTRVTLTSVTYTDGRLWAGGHDAVIITSGDRGETWTRLHFDPDRQQAVMDLYFTDEDNGTAIGSYGLYLQTRDGGQTWEDIEIDPEGGYHLNKMLRFDDGRRLIAGEAGYSYRSYDDGATWERLALPYQGSMWGALRVDEECVLFFGLRGHALESCDFGTTWTEVATGTEASISDGATWNGKVLMAANSGVVLTKDDGHSWKAIKHSSGVDFAAALSLGDGRFLLAGEDGVFEYPEIPAEESGDE